MQWKRPREVGGWDGWGSGPHSGQSHQTATWCSGSWPAKGRGLLAADDIPSTVSAADPVPTSPGPGARGGQLGQLSKPSSSPSPPGQGIPAPTTTSWDQDITDVGLEQAGWGVRDEKGRGRPWRGG